MTAVYLNHEDVRQLLFRLGEPKACVNGRPVGAMMHVGLCLGLPARELYHRCCADGPAFPHGVPMTRDNLLSLISAVEQVDMTALRNTKRLEVVAGAFGWKPDAFMHHLKTTTAGLGRSETLMPSYGSNKAPNHAGVDLSAVRIMFDGMRWIENGLFLFAGPTGSGKSTTLQTAAGLIPEQAWIVSVEPGMDQTMPKGADLRKIEAALRRSIPDVLLIPQIDSREAAEFALRMAERSIVLATINATSPMGAARALQKYAGRLDGECLLGIHCQHLVRSAPGAPSSRTTLNAVLRTRPGDTSLQTDPDGGDFDLDGIYADAACKIADGEIEAKTITSYFGTGFEDYQRRVAAVQKSKTTIVRSIDHATFSKFGSGPDLTVDQLEFIRPTNAARI